MLHQGVRLSGPLGGSRSPSSPFSCLCLSRVKLQSSNYSNRWASRLGQISPTLWGFEEEPFNSSREGPVAIPCEGDHMETSHGFTAADLLIPISSRRYMNPNASVTFLDVWVLRL